MKFESVKICAHPRSGSNYLAEIIDLNFTKTGDYSNVYGDHSIPSEDLFKNLDIGYIYLKRNYIDVAKSIFKMKERFRLSATSFEQFIVSRYDQMYNPNIKGVTKIVHHNSAVETFKSGKFFANVKMTPHDYYNLHIEVWEKYASKSYPILVVDYDQIVKNFDTEMKRISQFLGCSNDQFQNISEKVGYYQEDLLKTRVKLFLLNNQMAIFSRKILKKVLKIW